WGYFAKNSGDLTTARQAFGIQIKIRQAASDHNNLSRGFQNFAEVELLAGRWPAAREASAAALNHAEDAKHDPYRRCSHTLLATSCDGLGSLTEARHHFAEATKLNDEPMLYTLSGLWEAEL